MQKNTSLNGDWRLRDASGEYDLPIRLPGDGITALYEAGMIPDPYFGRNEYDLRWIADRDWVVSREFTLDDGAFELVLEGLDTIVDVTVNGIKLLSAENVFRTYTIDLEQVARVGNNTVELYFHSAPKEGAKRYAAHPYPIPYSEMNSPIPHGNMIRKTQCDFGWDWNIALAPFGVIGDIELRRKTKTRIEGVLLNQAHTEGLAVVTVRVPITTSEQKAEYEVNLCGQTRAGIVQGHSDQIECVFEIENPELWWPVGMGKQTLHQIEVRVGDGVAQRRIGLRDIGFHADKDDIGLSFKFSANGIDFFAKGANWIPADALSGRITREAVRGLLQSAIDAHMNMIRIWGGGRYEPNWFYDMCDEMGLLVWQDFMFACNLYPADATFLTEVEAEVREVVTRLNHHPSIALWCGDNELVGALTWYDEPRNNRDLYLVAYDRLNTQIERALTAVLPEANWWASSPSAGPMNFGDAWHDDTSGDMHFWSVWHEGKDFEHYRDIKPRFCSEFGFQSYASMETIRSFADPEDFNIAAPTLESHQKNAGGNARIAETMFRYFRFPVGFENFVYLSQIQHGLALKTAVSYWRSLKPHCMGTLIWQLNDTWPVASWASLNYGGSWKLPHYMIADFYQPVFVTAVPEGDKVRIVGINDTMEVVDIKVTIRATKLNGTSREILQANGVVGQDSAETLAEVEGIASDEILTFACEGADGGIQYDHVMLRPYKSYNFEAPQLKLEIKEKGADYEIVVSAERLALFVALEASVPGQFSQNVLTITPDMPATVRFTPLHQRETPKFIVNDLHSATYG
ncbi:glycoside hydrolase family 2 protein [Falsihalocynthiibacter sp. SS001]|uniref:beta-mannosidase n=1 Tax=Falsihalocynthiibacter sp. SS001 TaxID=3349698 RepID=UPI0036D22D97